MSKEMKILFGISSDNINNFRIVINELNKAMHLWVETDSIISKYNHKSINNIIIFGDYDENYNDFKSRIDNINRNIIINSRSILGITVLVNNKVIIDKLMRYDNMDDRTKSYHMGVINNGSAINITEVRLNDKKYYNETTTEENNEMINKKDKVDDNKPNGLAFFDFDGTIIIPRYEIDTFQIPGVNSKWWMYYHLSPNCGFFGDSNKSIANDDIIRIIKRYHENGYKIFVLTGIFSSKESDNKYEYCAKILTDEDGNPIITRDRFIGVGKVEYKFDIIEYYRVLYYGNDKSKIVYWDDDHSTAMNISAAGYETHHISEAGLYNQIHDLINDACIDNNTRTRKLNDIKSAQVNNIMGAKEYNNTHDEENDKLYEAVNLESDNSMGIKEDNYNNYEYKLIHLKILSPLRDDAVKFLNRIGDVHSNNISPINIGDSNMIMDDVCLTTASFTLKASDSRGLNRLINSVKSTCKVSDLKISIVDDEI